MGERARPALLGHDNNHRHPHHHAGTDRPDQPALVRRARSGLRADPPTSTPPGTTTTAPGCTSRSSTSATPACWRSPSRPSSAATAPPSARSPPSSASWPSTAARPHSPRRCTSTSPRSPRGATRRNLPGAEATLRKIADDGIVVVSTGGGDYTHPRGTAVKVDGGYRVTGRKSFVSQAPVGAVLSTMFVYDDPARGLRVLNMSVPFASEGVAHRRALGHHGHARHGEPRRRLRRRVRARRARAWPTARTARSTRRCR